MPTETQDSIIDNLQAIALEPHAKFIITEYNRLLAILGNADEDEIVLLALLAQRNVEG